MRIGLACVLVLASGCSLANDFGEFVFEGGGRSDSGPEDRDAGNTSGGGRGGSDSERDAATKDAGDDERDAAARDGGDDPVDSGNMTTVDAGKDSGVDAGPPPDPLCDVAPCDEVASCSSATGKAVCTCPHGYYDFSGDGSDCVDLNECRAGLFQCDDEATCSNTQGGYECLCNPGFVKNGQDCIDSCLVLLSTTCDPNVGLCTKPSGNAVCRCPSGYMDVNGDGTRCDPDLACMALNCDPIAQCNGNDPVPACRCPDGYSGDGTVCADVDECALESDDCDDDASCANTQGGFLCVCNDGYAGDGKSCDDVDECSAGTHACSANADCSNSVGSYGCACRRGYNGDGYGCTDDDECMLGSDDCSSNANCSNTPGSFGCACKNGYSGDGRTCDDVDECTAGTNDCDPNEECANTQGSFTCGCDAGYRKNASGDCVDVDECVELLANCSSNAICRNTSGSFACSCKDGYSGDGVTCNDVNECMTGAHNCSPNATCSNNAGSFSCACKLGYSGSGVTCNDIDECGTGAHNCHPTRANCSNNGGGFSCTCKDGFSGNGVTCSDVDECAANTDTCDGIPDACVNTPGSWNCACPGTGYSGNGQGPDGCIDKDECMLNTDNCDSMPEACKNTTGSFQCVCPNTYMGDGVGANGCADKDECALNLDTCDDMPNACVNFTGGYSCACPGNGYTGTGQGPTGCMDKDECTLNTDNCDDNPNACKNTDGSFMCMCPNGQVGNGQGTYGCCLPDGTNTDVAKPNDGMDNECDGLWDKPVIVPAATWPEFGAASSRADVTIAIAPPTGIPGATLQCRHYKRTTTVPPAYATCANPIVNNATASDGAWRTDIRFSWPDGRFSHTTTHDYYLHASLNGAPHCNLPPTVTDDAIFMAADAYLKAGNVAPGKDPGTFQPADTFLQNPFVTVTYKPLDAYYFTLRRGIGASGAAGTAYPADMWSLRKRFVIGGGGRYVLMRRTYVSRARYSLGQYKDCKVARIAVVNSHWAAYPPPPPPAPQPTTRDFYSIYDGYSCDVVVVNRAGAGVCINIGPAPTYAITIGPQHHKNPVALTWGYKGPGTSAGANNFMWRHLIDESGWHHRFKNTYPAPETGYRNFSQKCDTADCNRDNEHELYLPDKSVYR